MPKTNMEKHHMMMHVIRFLINHNKILSEKSSNQTVSLGEFKHPSNEEKHFTQVPEELTKKREEVFVWKDKIEKLFKWRNWFTKSIFFEKLGFLWKKKGEWKNKAKGSVFYVSVCLWHAHIEIIFTFSKLIGNCPKVCGLLFLK